MQGVRKNMKYFLFDFTAPIRNNISMKIKFPVISFKLKKQKINKIIINFKFLFYVVLLF